jgi:Mn2+/Fe2+ NRAMP family transporter
MFFIITACAATLHISGITTIGTAAEAAKALRPLAGDYSYFLFAVGIIGVGLLGIPVLAGSSSYALAESFGWKQGLHFKLRQAYAFYGVIIISISIGVLLNLVGLDPIKALIYAAVLNGCTAPVTMILILVISSKEKIMGRWKSGFATKLVGTIAIVLMSCASIATIWSLLK